MLATFVMPTINDTFLVKSIGSILWQSVEDWELLVYNNRPSRKLSFEDKRITVINTDNWSIPKCINDAHIGFNEGADQCSIYRRS